MANFSQSLEFERYLNGISFPVTAEGLMHFMRSHGAPAGMLSKLRFSPNHTFTSLADLHFYFGVMGEFRHAETANQNAPKIMPAPKRAPPTDSAGAK